MLVRAQKHWNRLLQNMSDSEDYWFLTPTHYAMFRILKPILNHKPFKNVLDIGAGHLVFKHLLDPATKNYISLDIQKKHPEQDLVGSGEFLPVKSGSMDLVFCSAVLEHTIEPVKILKEIGRVVADKGMVLLTVPHFQNIHGEPNDYWRFTRYGIECLLELSKMKFDVLVVNDVGYFLNFCVSMLIPAIVGIFLSWGVPAKIILPVLKPFCVIIYRLDKAFSVPKLSLGYIASMMNNP